MLTADFSKGLPDLRSGVYRHYKGPLYFVFGYGHDANEDTLGEFYMDKTARSFRALGKRNVVVYMGLELIDAHKGPRLAVRTAEDFFALVCHEHGKNWDDETHTCSSSPVSRFEYIGPEWLGQR